VCVCLCSHLLVLSLVHPLDNLRIATWNVYISVINIYLITYDILLYFYTVFQTLNRTVDILPLSTYENVTIAVLVVGCNRPDAIKRTLDQLLKFV
jgi:hypothetical protein